MKELKTVPRNRSFHYEGSIENGITLYFGTGRKETVTKDECYQLLQRFNGRLVNIGRSFNNPPENSLGEWLLEHVSKRAVASYLAPVLVEEGYARWNGSGEIQFSTM